MASFKSPFLTSVLVALLASSKLAHASYEEDVSYAVDVLSALDSTLAEPFCHGYHPYPATTETYYVTDPGYTYTSTVCEPKPTYGYPVESTYGYPAEPTHGYPTKTTYGYPAKPTSKYPGKPTAKYPGKPTAKYPGKPTAKYPVKTTKKYPSKPTYGSETKAPEPTSVDEHHASLITVTSTTTTTFTYTSTTYVDASAPTSTHAARFKRDSWCVDEEVPCRLAVYSTPVIQAACAQYLPHGYTDSYGETVTITQHVWGPAYTETVTAGYCDTGYPVAPPPEEYPTHETYPSEDTYTTYEPYPTPVPEYDDWSPEHPDDWWSEPEYDEEYGDGEGPPPSWYHPEDSPYDGEGPPPSWYHPDESPYDGEDTPPYYGGDDGYGDGEGPPGYWGDGKETGDGEGLPDWAEKDGPTPEDGVWED